MNQEKVAWAAKSITGWTLEGLAQRLEGQALQLEALVRENASLRQELEALRDLDTGQVEEFAARFEGPPSSRQPNLAARSPGHV